MAKATRSQRNSRKEGENRLSITESHNHGELRQHCREQLKISNYSAPSKRNDSTPPPSASQPEEIAVKLSAQFESYCANISTYEHMKPGFDIDLKHHSEYLHKFWRDRLSTVPELSQFALANLCFSGAGVGVERLFSGAAIQAEGRLRVLSNTGLRERTMIASNRDLIE